MYSIIFIQIQHGKLNPKVSLVETFPEFTKRIDDLAIESSKSNQFTSISATPFSHLSGNSILVGNMRQQSQISRTTLTKLLQISEGTPSILSLPDSDRKWHSVRLPRPRGGDDESKWISWRRRRCG